MTVPSPDLACPMPIGHQRFIVVRGDRAGRSRWPDSTGSAGTRRSLSGSSVTSMPTAPPPDVQQAEARYREALMLAEALGMRPLQAHCHGGLGALYATIGRREPARAELSAAIELYHAMEMTFWLPQAEAALAHIGG
jgi:hypothetical protein